MSEAAWLLEALLTVLLALSLFHALRLERALATLRRDRARLEALLEGFNDSTRMAEEGIERLRLASEGAGRQLTRQIERASVLREDLSFLCERADKSADGLERSVRERRVLANERARLDAESRPGESGDEPCRGIPLHPARGAPPPGSSRSRPAYDLSPSVPHDPGPGRSVPSQETPRTGAATVSGREEPQRGPSFTSARAAASFPPPRAEASPAEPRAGAPVPSEAEPAPCPPAEPRVRSKAERDLLRALQLGR